MTLEEAIKTDRQLILTLDPPDGDPPFTVVMVQPYFLTQDCLYGCLEGGFDAGYMPFEEAAKFIWRSCEQFLKQRT